MSVSSIDRPRPCLTALDLGVHRFRSLRRVGGRTVGRGCRAAYGALPDSPARRRLLDQVGLDYATTQAGRDGEAAELLLFGDAADEYAKLFGTPPLALLPDGAVADRRPAGPADRRGTLIDVPAAGPAVRRRRRVKVVYPRQASGDREFLARGDPAPGVRAGGGRRRRGVRRPPRCRPTGFRGLALICGGRPVGTGRGAGREGGRPVRSRRAAPPPWTAAGPRTGPRWSTNATAKSTLGRGRLPPHP